MDCMLHVILWSRDTVGKMVLVSGACVMQSGPEFSCYQFRTCSVLLPVLVSTADSDWSLLLLLIFVYLPAVNSCKYCVVF